MLRWITQPAGVNLLNFFWLLIIFPSISDKQNNSWKSAKSRQSKADVQVSLHRKTSSADALSGRGDSWSVWNIPSEGCCQCCRCCQCCTLARLSKATQRHSVQTRFPSKISEFLQHKFGRRFFQDGGTVKLCDDDFIIEFHFLRNGCLVRLCTLMNHPKRGRD